MLRISLSFFLIWSSRALIFLSRFLAYYINSSQVFLMLISSSEIGWFFKINAIFSYNSVNFGYLNYICSMFFEYFYWSSLSFLWSYSLSFFHSCFLFNFHFLFLFLFTGGGGAFVLLFFLFQFFILFPYLKVSLKRLVGGGRAWAL